MTAPPLLLASRSPRRQALLAQIGVRFRTVAIDIDETPGARESPADFVCRLALEKAETGRRHCGTSAAVLGADTTVVVDGDMLGKPRDAAHAEAMLERLSGRGHHVFTGVALTIKATELRLSESRVWFRPTTARERAAYCATGEPLDKAGGYAIQGLAAVFVSRLEGSFSGVTGLPLFETAELLSGAGIDILAPP